MILAILGADGSGKSSVIKGLEESLKDLYDRVHIFHVRPRLDHKQTKGLWEPVSEPHGLPNRSWLFSVCKLIYFWLDYQLGFWFKIRPLLRDAQKQGEKALVVFDRYYHDVLVDTKRYRYGGSMTFARWVGALIPKPDCVVLLDAPAEVLQARKQEVPFEETERQREAYVRLVQSLPYGHVVDASVPVDEVLVQVRALIQEENRSEARG